MARKRRTKMTPAVRAAAKQVTSNYHYGKVTDSTRVRAIRRLTNLTGRRVRFNGRVTTVGRGDSKSRFLPKILGNPRNSDLVGGYGSTDVLTRGRRITTRSTSRRAVAKSAVRRKTSTGRTMGGNLRSLFNRLHPRGRGGRFVKKG